VVLGVTACAHVGYVQRHSDEADRARQPSRCYWRPPSSMTMAATAFCAAWTCNRPARRRCRPRSRSFPRPRSLSSVRCTFATTDSSRLGGDRQAWRRFFKEALSRSEK
jgi:hypothetical protein